MSKAFGNLLKHIDSLPHRKQEQIYQWIKRYVEPSFSVGGQLINKMRKTQLVFSAKQGYSWLFPKLKKSGKSTFSANLRFFSFFQFIIIKVIVCGTLLTYLFILLAFKIIKTIKSMFTVTVAIISIQTFTVVSTVPVVPNVMVLFGGMVIMLIK